MPAKRSNRWTPVASLAIMASLIVIGNLRAPVSAAVPVQAQVDAALVGAVPPRGDAVIGTPVGRKALAKPSALESMVGADVDEPVAEIGALVPALYAWNPDVRFIYFRQVSKWM